MNSSLRERWWAAAAGATIYLAAALVGRATVTDAAPIALFWPAAGVAICWLLLCSSRIEMVMAFGWIAVVVFTQAWGVFGQPGPAALTAIAHVMLAALTVVGLGRGTNTRPSLRNLSSTGGLVRVTACAAVASTLTAPIFATAVRSSTGAWSPGTAGAWVGRNLVATAMVVVTVAVLTTWWCDGEPRARSLTAAPRGRAAAELVLVAAVTGVVTTLVFGIHQSLPLAFVLTGVVAWLGSRFSPWVVALGVCAIAVGVLALTANGRGVFAAVEDPLWRALVAQLFLGACLSLGLLLSFGEQHRCRLLRMISVSEEDARSQARLLEAVTRSMTDGLAVVSSTGELILTNPTGAALLMSSERVSLDDPARHGFFDVSGAPLDQHHGLHYRALAGEVITGELLLHVDSKTGNRTIQSVSASPLDGWSGHETVAVFLTRDVTDAHLHLRQVQGFAGMVAHDLKSPLAIMSGWSQILSEELGQLGDDAAQAASMLARVRSAGDRMDTLISELLIYTRAQSAALTTSEVDLGALVDDVAAHLTHDVDADISHVDLPVLLVDAVLLRQVFVNLIGNSLKYVASGTRPRVELHGTRAGGDWVELRVSDNGIGIPDGQHERVFDPFTRMHTDYAGTGLGLSICQTIAARHGGSLTARARDGGGTTMTLRLPALVRVGVWARTAAAPAADAGPFSLTDQNHI